MIVLSLIFILVHIGIGIALFYSDEPLNYWGISAYIIILGIFLLIGIRFGFKKFILSAIVFSALFGFGWYAYNYVNIPHINECPNDLPLRGSDNRCYACDTPRSIDIRNPNINPCPNRKIGKRYCCGVEYDVSSLEARDNVFDTVLCRCVKKFSKLFRFSFILIAISFYISIWALFLWAIRPCGKKR